MTDASLAAPAIRRVRHELLRRELTVAAVERLTPVMIRVTLEGPSLSSFVSPSPDDHIKIMLPGASEDEPVMREYTPRAFDTQAGRLVLDFVDHGDGPAGGWARAAKAGDALPIGGPRGSRVIEGVRSWLLVGDETALPAIGRFLEALAPGERAQVIAAVPGPQDEQSFETAGEVEIRWIHRPLAQAHEPAPLLEALEAAPAQPPETFAWIAAEAGVAKALRQSLIARGHPTPWLKAAGYWLRGQADSSIKDIGEEAAG